MLDDRVPVRLVGTVGEARELLARSEDVLGVVLDVQLPDASGLELLEDSGVVLAGVPVLVLTGSLDAEIANRATAKGAMVAAKPCDLPTFGPFIAQCEARSKPGAGPDRGSPRRDHALREILEQECKKHGLTARHRQILKLHLRGKNRREAIESLGIAEKTYENHTRRMLKKAGAPRVSDLVARILRRALKQQQA